MALGTLLIIAVAGFAAQLVDGGLGMGFGVTSMTILTTLGAMAPATASAVVNTSQLGTTLVSGASHWKFGNVNWRVALLIGIPGAVGAFIGATLLSNISMEVAKPLTASILAVIGAFLIYRFASGQFGQRSRSKERPGNRPLVGSLAVLGGFLSSSGGGGWGPVMTSTMMLKGNVEPRKIVGTVNAAEFMVTVAAVIAFVFGLWEEIVANLAAAAALLVGGVIGAPIAAWAITKMNSTLLGGAVGTLLLVLNVPNLLNSLGLEGPWMMWVRIGILVVGLALSVWGARRAKRIADASPVKKDIVSESEAESVPVSTRA